MEDRRPIHYHRNTVIVPKLGKKSRFQMTKKPYSMSTDGRKVPQDRSPKVCSTDTCPRCNAQQQYWRATCWRCGACFYCGLVGGSAFQCHICNNVIPKDDRQRPTEQSIKIV